jgi:hypothetical protein
MALAALQAHFKSCPLKHSAGWYLRVTWDSGRTAQVDGFATEADAEPWIATNSIARVKARQTGSHG